MHDVDPAGGPQDRLNPSAEHLKANIGPLSVRGGATTTAAQAIAFAIQMTSTVVLARLLTPADFGLIAMVTAVTGFAGMFKDLGLSMATVQRAEITHEQISNLFWVNVGVSLLIALITVAFAPLIAWFYGDSRLTAIAAALSVALIFGGLGVQHLALLQRQMRFTALAAIQTISALVGVAAGIGAALLGAGYWSLVIMQIAGPFAKMIGAWLACRWRPGWLVRRSGVRGMLAFGVNITGFNALNYFARNLDDILIGWRWGAETLGFYSKAYSLMMLPLSQINSPVSSVAIPALSRLQDDPERYRQYYLRAISVVAFVTMPGMAFLVVMSRQVILAVLGPQWTEAARIFMILALAGLVQPLGNTTGWLYVSQGRTNDMFKWGMISSFMTVLVFVVGLPWGAVGVAVSYSIYNWAVTPFLYWFAGRKGPVKARHIGATLLQFLWVSVCVMAALLLFQAYVPVSDLFIDLVSALSITIFVAPLALLPFSRGRGYVRNFVEVALLLAGRRTRRCAEL